ncbi:YeeE/YedE family protein [Pseudenhygromyxa sp. WMMC2535]|uniref:YeeE/YedE family protein n=1 Tax=Pseudenhygromyxa sp. WMMC2535 TaxID=2712867 RepID=UPI0015546D7F|nr:YeeE/YedE family protein [Pseudenhygromyxa sp. WMMC2535]NVB40976.1 YeeE/YedE family protein [Pseudenhygromyxa sp. WMMC2535]
MTPTEFTPIASTIGGVMIGLSAAFMLIFKGRIAGISGILGGFIEGGEGRTWRGLFLLGMLIGGVGLLLALPSTMPGAATDSLPMLIVAGLLVGFGTRLGGGCTSGHGVCGISRFSTRSLTATAIFMTAAGLTTFVVRHLLGIGGVA